MTDGDYVYPGRELELFERAENWKEYWGSRVTPFLGATVAEIGAGIGANTVRLSVGRRLWICVEPDVGLAARIEQRKAKGELGLNCEVVIGRLADLPPDVRFDTVLYVDVLEHIPDDRMELAEAARRLNSKGFLVVLSPAYQWLFTPFDLAVGHLRRYTAKSLRSLAPPGLRPRIFQYLDSVGLVASLANVLILKASSPTSAQIRLWDQIMVPVSRLADRLMGFRVGKSILAVWQAP